MQVGREEDAGAARADAVAEEVLWLAGQEAGAGVVEVGFGGGGEGVGWERRAGGGEVGDLAGFCLHSGCLVEQF